MYLLETKNLTKVYENEKGIFNINLEIEKGDIYGFLGPNGSGKTTTIRTILNLIHKDSGKVYINGVDIEKDFNKAISAVGAIVETPKFYEYLSGYANLKIIARYYNIAQDRIHEVLKLVGLEKRASDKVKTYSLGMKQRLGIARSLIQNPKLVILDEPTNGLDPQGMKEVREMIRRLSKEEGITFFISTHLLNEVEQICNKVCILNHGKIIQQGYVKDLLVEDAETIQVSTEEIEKSLSVVKNVDYVREVEPNKDGIIVRIHKGYSNQLIKLLVTNDINLNYIIPKSQSLEQYFLDTIQGGEQYA